MISISNCPITGLHRKLTYDFYWLQSVRRIVINCMVSHYEESGEHVKNARIVDYTRALIASDNKVNPTTGHIFTEEELNVSPAPTSILEYDFYVGVIGVSPVVLPTLVESIIHARDVEGKFNI